MTSQTYERIHTTTWRNFVSAYHALPQSQYNWIFRGQRDSTWFPMSTIERTLVHRYRLPYSTLPAMERSLVTSFQRGCHHYIESPPQHNETVEWWSLMQHYGAPTRLVDWSYSFYVSAFFAIESMAPDTTCAVYALELNHFVEASKRQMSKDAIDAMRTDPRAKDPSTVNRILSGSPLAFPVNPFRLNQRLRIQQGLFLAAGDLTQAFEANFSKTVEQTNSPQYFKKIELTADLPTLNEGLMDLRRMNLTTESIYPGIEGFARGLHQKAVLRQVDSSIGSRPEAESLDRDPTTRR